MQFNKNTIKTVNFIFDIDNISFIEIINFVTSLKNVIFHIVFVNISFLLLLIDFDKFEAFLNNIQNELIQNNCLYSIICWYKHVFMLWYISTYFFIIEFLNMNLCYFIEIKFCRLHCCFEYFSIHRFYDIFNWINYEIDFDLLIYFIEFCEFCQKHNNIFRKFAFLIENNVEFNYNVIVDIFNINDKNVLHFIDRLFFLNKKSLYLKIK